MLDKFNNLDLIVPDCRNMIFVQFRSMHVLPSDKAEVKPADIMQFFVLFFLKHTCSKTAWLVSHKNLQRNKNTQGSIVSQNKIIKI